MGTEPGPSNVYAIRAVGDRSLKETFRGEVDDVNDWDREIDGQPDGCFGMG